MIEGAPPELAVPAAVLHGDDPEGAVAAIEATRDVEEERRRVYWDLVYGSLGDVARKAVEAIMRDRNYQPLTEIGREMLARGREESREEGRRLAMIVAIESACDELGVELTDARKRSLGVLTSAELEALLRALVRARAWPGH